jgi:hypothetical protein
MWADWQLVVETFDGVFGRLAAFAQRTQSQLT